MDQVNEVRLCGRVTQVGEERVLPSGDVVVTWRMVVDRPPPRRASAAKATRRAVDVVDIACWSAATRRVASRLDLGASVHVEGSLRRRFFRGSHGVQSRTEVEAHLVRRLTTGARAAAAPDELGEVRR